MIRESALGADVDSLVRESINLAALVGIPYVASGCICCVQLWKTSVDVQSEHVNDATAAERCHLDTRYKMKAAFPGPLRCCSMTRGRIMIGQCCDLNSRVGDDVDQSDRVETAVAMVAVQVEIAEHACVTRLRRSRS